MRKRLSSILRSVAIGGLLASAVVRVLIQFTASPVPDPASGRTEFFAPFVSSDWQYITPLQSLLRTVLTGSALVCLAAWIAIAWMGRRADAAERPFHARRIGDRHGR